MIHLNWPCMIITQITYQERSSVHKTKIMRSLMSKCSDHLHTSLENTSFKTVKSINFWYVQTLIFASMVCHHGDDLENGSGSLKWYEQLNPTGKTHTHTNSNNYHKQCLEILALECTIKYQHLFLPSQEKS